jgi:hypothetical protein
MAACQPSPVSTPSADVQVTDVTENDLVTGEINQTKTFDQCGSSSIFKTEVQFSDNSAKTNQSQLVLGAEITGGATLPSALKLEIKGSIEKHFSETLQQGQGHFESVSIEVPAYTKQEYTITWQETRRTGTVEYVENGGTKSIAYSYRVGLELISASGKDLPCSTPEPETSLTPVEAPTKESIAITPIDGRVLSPVETVLQYYQYLNGGEYDKAWRMFTIPYRQNKYAARFDEYKTWAANINSVEVVEPFIILEQSDLAASVEIFRVTYHLENAVNTYGHLKIYLARDSASSEWRIEGIGVK